MYLNFLHTQTARKAKDLRKSQFPLSLHTVIRSLIIFHGRVKVYTHTEHINLLQGSGNIPSN